MYNYVYLTLMIFPDKNTKHGMDFLLHRGNKTSKFNMMNYHDPPESSSNLTKDSLRALHSLKEEVEAIDWYQQRLENSSNAELKRILKHNLDEEIEHACMILEWLRKNMDGWDKHLKESLYGSANADSN